MMNHPLAMVDNDDDISSVIIKPSAADTKMNNRVTMTPQPSDTDNKLDQQSLTMTATKFKAKVNKRMAPKAPDEQHIPTTSIDKPLCFFMPVEHVRWFYKTEKDKHHHSSTASTNGTGATTIIDKPTDPNNISPNGYPSNDPNNNVIKITVVKKWEMFNKWDSINLETKYRELVMMSKQNGVMPSEDDPAVLVQVQNYLYEVNLITKKCHPIYLKNGKKIKVQRCLWYRDSNEPFDEKVGEEIEKRHVELFRDKLMMAANGSYGEMASTNTPVMVSQAAFFQEDTLSIQDCAGSLNGDPVVKTVTKTVKTEPTKNQNLEPISSLQFEDGVIKWFSETEVYLEKSKTTVVDKTLDLLKYNKSKISSGTKIKRGYKQKDSCEISEEKPPNEITHLVFVVHGIAQKLYENGILKSCEDLSKECEKQKKENLSAYDEHRYIFLPVDWRSSLTLDDGIIESITLNSIQMIRDKLNASLLDIMYYTSPLFKTEIIMSLASETNRLYNLFCQKNPTFKEKHNKVSIVAHSLGSVIIYDILKSNEYSGGLFDSNGEESNTENLFLNQFASMGNTALRDEYTSCKNRALEIEKILISGTNKNISFDFKTENFFLFGSPLAVFLALRGIRPGGSGSQDHILSKNLCKRIFNIFHPSDPVAYRLEPLILKHYITKSPSEIERASDVSKKGFQKDASERRSALDIDLKSALTRATTNLNKKKEKDSKSAELSQMMNAEHVVNFTNSNNTVNKGPSPIDQVELDEELDFQLQEANFELMATLKAHSCYWKSSDVALFLMRQLCQNDDKENSVNNTNQRNNKSK